MRSVCIRITAPVIRGNICLEMVGTFKVLSLDDWWEAVACSSNNNRQQKSKIPECRNIAHTESIQTNPALIHSSADIGASVRFYYIFILTDINPILLWEHFYYSVFFLLRLVPEDVGNELYEIEGWTLNVINPIHGTNTVFQRLRIRYLCFKRVQRTSKKAPSLCENIEHTVSVAGWATLWGVGC